MRGWWTILGVFQGGFVTGLTLAILYLYMRHLGRLTRLARHIMGVGVSYLILSILPLVDLVGGLHADSALWFWSLIVAYGLGDYSLLVMLALQYERLKQSP